MTHDGGEGSERPSRTRMIWSALLLLGFAIVVLVITLTPEPVDRGLRPTISFVLSAFHEHGVPSWFDYSTIEFGANIVLFAPLGFLLVMLLPIRRWWLALLIGPALSIGIELTQLTTLSDRFASIGDVFANSSGVFIGTGLSFALRLMEALREAERAPAQI